MKLRILGLSGVFVALYSLGALGIPLCGFRWITGLPCPLCGLTHALFALAQGHLAEALRLHALSPLAAAMLAAFVWNPAGLGRFATACACAFGAYGIARMIF
jgi:hypothetical protein